MYQALRLLLLSSAVALVVGVDPLNPAAELWRAKPVLDRMTEGHRQARNMVSQPMAPSQFEIVRRTSPDAFVCVLFDRFPMLQKEAWPGDANRPYELPRRLAGPDGSFELQKFSRAEVQRWLDRQGALSTGISSVYQFVKPVNITASIDAATTAEEPLAPQSKHGADDRQDSTRWPAHETDALRALRLASVKFWKNYDPSDPSSAPYAKEVIAWLKDDQRQSQTMATSMASILRPNGLKKGPRSNS